jgi:hypothetical protein
MQEFQVGIFASLDKSYERLESGEYGYVERITYRVHDWCNEHGIAHYAKEGHVLVEMCTVRLSAPVTRLFIVEGMVSGLKTKRTELQADTQAQITAIDAKINELLALEYCPAVQEPGFAPRRHNDDVTDV